MAPRQVVAPAMDLQAPGEAEPVMLMAESPFRGISADPQNLIAHQYSDASNLDARVALHERFSVNPRRFQSWVFETLRLAPGDRVLDVGCGPGGLWVESSSRLAGLAPTLVDLSPGTIAAARERLAVRPTQFTFLSADIQMLPFKDSVFDVVVANHMLYHVSDRTRALAEVWRVLKAGGRFRAITNGERHMFELRQLAAQVPGDCNPFSGGEKAFSLENGAEQLARIFPRPTLLLFEDALEVTETEPMVEYLLSLSGSVNMCESDLEALRAVVQGEIDRNGAFHVTKAVGMFESWKVS